MSVHIEKRSLESSSASKEEKDEHKEDKKRFVPIFKKRKILLGKNTKAVNIEKKSLSKNNSSNTHQLSGKINKNSIPKNKNGAISSVTETKNVSKAEVTKKKMTKTKKENGRKETQSVKTPENLKPATTGDIESSEKKRQKNSKKNCTSSTLNDIGNLSAKKIKKRKGCQGSKSQIDHTSGNDSDKENIPQDLFDVLTLQNNNAPSTESCVELGSTQYRKRKISEKVENNNPVKFLKFTETSIPAAINKKNAIQLMQTEKYLIDSDKNSSCKELKPEKNVFPPSVTEKSDIIKKLSWESISCNDDSNPMKMMGKILGNVVDNSNIVYLNTPVMSNIKDDCLRIDNIEEANYIITDREDTPCDQVKIGNNSFENNSKTESNDTIILNSEKSKGNDKYHLNLVLNDEIGIPVECSYALTKPDIRNETAVESEVPAVETTCYHKTNDARDTANENRNSLIKNYEVVLYNSVTSEEATSSFKSHEDEIIEDKTLLNISINEIDNKKNNFSEKIRLVGCLDTNQRDKAENSSQTETFEESNEGSNVLQLQTTELSIDVTSTTSIDNTKDKLSPILSQMKRKVGTEKFTISYIDMNENINNVSTGKINKLMTTTDLDFGIIESQNLDQSGSIHNSDEEKKNMKFASSDSNDKIENSIASLSKNIPQNEDQQMETEAKISQNLQLSSTNIEKSKQSQESDDEELFCSKQVTTGNIVTESSKNTLDNKKYSKCNPNSDSFKRVSFELNSFLVLNGLKSVNFQKVDECKESIYNRIEDFQEGTIEKNSTPETLTHTENMFSNSRYALNTAFKPETSENNFSKKEIYHLTQSLCSENSKQQVEKASSAIVSNETSVEDRSFSLTEEQISLSSEEQIINLTNVENETNQIISGIETTSKLVNEEIQEADNMLDIIKKHLSLLQDINFNTKTYPCDSIKDNGYAMNSKVSGNVLGLETNGEVNLKNIDTKMKIANGVIVKEATTTARGYLLESKKEYIENDNSEGMTLASSQEGKDIIANDKNSMENILSTECLMNSYSNSEKSSNLECTTQSKFSEPLCLPKEHNCFSKLEFEKILWSKLMEKRKRSKNFTDVDKKKKKGFFDDLENEEYLEKTPDPFDTKLQSPKNNYEAMDCCKNISEKKDKYSDIAKEKYNFFDNFPKQKQGKINDSSFNDSMEANICTFQAENEKLGYFETIENDDDLDKAPTSLHTELQWDENSHKAMDFNNTLEKSLNKISNITKADDELFNDSSLQNQGKIKGCSGIDSMEDEKLGSSEGTENGEDLENTPNFSDVKLQWTKNKMEAMEDEKLGSSEGTENGEDLENTPNFSDVKLQWTKNKMEAMDCQQNILVNSLNTLLNITKMEDTFLNNSPNEKQGKEKSSSVNEIKEDEVNTSLARKEKMGYFQMMENEDDFERTPDYFNEEPQWTQNKLESLDFAQKNSGDIYLNITKPEEKIFNDSLKQNEDKTNECSAIEVMKDEESIKALLAEKDKMGSAEGTKNGEDLNKTPDLFGTELQWTENKFESNDLNKEILKTTVDNFLNIMKTKEVLDYSKQNRGKIKEFSITESIENEGNTLLPEEKELEFFDGVENEDDLEKTDHFDTEFQLTENMFKSWAFNKNISNNSKDKYTSITKTGDTSFNDSLQRYKDGKKSTIGSMVKKLKTLMGNETDQSQETATHSRDSSYDVTNIEPLFLRKSVAINHDNTEHTENRFSLPIYNKELPDQNNIGNVVTPSLDVKEGHSSYFCQKYSLPAIKKNIEQDLANIKKNNNTENIEKTFNCKDSTPTRNSYASSVAGKMKVNYELNLENLKMPAIDAIKPMSSKEGFQENHASTSSSDGSPSKTTIADVAQNIKEPENPVCEGLEYNSEMDDDFNLTASQLSRLDADMYLENNYAVDKISIGVQVAPPLLDLPTHFGNDSISCEIITQLHLIRESITKLQEEMKGIRSQMSDKH